MCACVCVCVCACVRVYIYIYIYILARRIYTIITYKKLGKFHPKDLYISLHQGGYPKTLINKGIDIAEKIPLKEL